MAAITCIEDLRQLYRRRVPRMFYDYAETGSYSLQTFRDNVDDFAAIRLRQRVGVDLAHRTTQARMLGAPATMPVALAPVGLVGMQCADGEIKAARAAEQFGVPFTLSTHAICSIEDIATHTSKPFWFQLYVMRDEAFTARLIARAKAAKCSALVLTVDCQILGQRHVDIKNGLSAPPRPTLANILNMALKPRWWAGMLATRRHSFGNFMGHVPGVNDMESLNRWAGEQFEPTLDWSRIKKLRRQWGGKFIIKGIMEPEDARKALACGADAIVVSNHGGRQLDGALSSIRVLPAIVETVRGKAEVWLDSGVRSGQDIYKALALGADGVLIGRAFVYGLGALGQPGVRQALEILRAELDVTMALSGRTSIGDITRADVILPEDARGRLCLAREDFK